MNHRPTRRPARVPRFALYGETDAVPGTGHPLDPMAMGLDDLLHVEPIQSRSRLYRWEIDAHVHDGRYQVLWLAAGPVRILLDENRSDRAGPLAVLIPPGTVHAFRFSAASQGHVLTLRARCWLDEPALAPQATRLFAQPQVLAWDGGADAALRLGRLFDALMDEFAPATPATPSPAWLARAVLWRLAEALPRADGPRDGRTAGQQRRQATMARFQALVEQHLLSHWPVTRYAAALNIGTERLNRLVRAEAGCSALVWVHRRLALEACRRLAHTAAPVARLADELGFDDAAYFSRFMRRHTGLSPRQWRERHAAAE
jgi:AraC family transcriptional regulator, transcriptional activator of pobA